MNKIAKKTLLKALRSGKYKQIKQQLYKDGGYCCLGLLCEVAYDGEWTKKNSTWGFYDPNFLNKYSMFHDSLLAWFLLHLFEMTDKEQMKLASMNDDGKSFKEIADYIDKNL